jgi:hypothetical protein
MSAQRDRPEVCSRALDRRFWPFSELASGLADVRSPRHGALDLLRLSSSHFDPKQANLGRCTIPRTEPNTEHSATAFAVTS